MRFGLGWAILQPAVRSEVLLNHVEVLLATFLRFAGWLELNLRLRMLLKLNHGVV